MSPPNGGDIILNLYTIITDTYIKIYMCKFIVVEESIVKQTFSKHIIN